MTDAQTAAHYDDTIDRTPLELQYLIHGPDTPPKTESYVEYDTDAEVVGVVER